MNKKLIILFSCIVLVVILIVIFCAVFVVKNINVSGEIDFKQEDIIASSKVKKGTSIFALSQNKIIYNIESDFANLKVVSVVRKFPNTIIFNIKERLPVFTVKINGSLFFVDEECKVLSKATEPSNNYIEIINYIPAAGENENNVIGKYLGNESYSNPIKNIVRGASELNFVGPGFINLFSSIELLSSGYIYIQTQVQGYGVKFVLQNGTKISEQMHACYSILVSENLTASQKREGYLVWEENTWKHKITI